MVLCFIEMNLNVHGTCVKLLLIFSQKDRETQKPASLRGISDVENPSRKSVENYDTDRMVALVRDQLKQAQMHTPAQRHACTLTLCFTHKCT